MVAFANLKLKESDQQEFDTKGNELGDFDKERMQLVSLEINSNFFYKVEANYQCNPKKFQLLQSGGKLLGQLQKIPTASAKWRQLPGQFQKIPERWKGVSRSANAIDFIQKKSMAIITIILFLLSRPIPSQLPVGSQATACSNVVRQLDVSFNDTEAYKLQYDPSLTKGQKTSIALLNEPDTYCR